MFGMIFDTETTSLEKPFCYNIGYVIVNLDNGEIVTKKDFVVEQVWHNTMLFTTAYYANKREIYVSRMKAHKVIMNKFGYICREMARDIKEFEISTAYAFNSAFDEKVFNFNCDWFKCINPFDTVNILDIRGFAHHFLVDDNYKAFCDTHAFYTDSENYSTTAETMFRYIDNNIDFEEEHTALSDSEIESALLMECLKRGANPIENYTAFKSIKRRVEKTFTVKKNNEIIFQTECFESTYKKTLNTIYLK